MAHIGDLKPDTHNPRSHPERNVRAIVKSLEEVGAARSIVIDENNRILCGNGLVDGAAIAGIENVQIVDADGDTIIAVRRSNLTETQKKRLAVLDNRASELAEWDGDVLKELIGEGVDLSDLFFDNELAILTGDIQTPDDPRALWDGMPEFNQENEQPHSSIYVHFRNEQDRMKFLELMGEAADRQKSIWYPSMPYLKQSV